MRALGLLVKNARAGVILALIGGNGLITQPHSFLGIVNPLFVEYLFSVCWLSGIIALAQYVHLMKNLQQEENSSTTCIAESDIFIDR